MVQPYRYGGCTCSRITLQGLFELSTLINEPSGSDFRENNSHRSHNAENSNREAFQKKSARLERLAPHVDRAAILSLAFHLKMVQKSGMNA